MSRVTAAGLVPVTLIGPDGSTGGAGPFLSCPRLACLPDQQRPALGELVARQLQSSSASARCHHGAAWGREAQE